MSDRINDFLDKICASVKNKQCTAKYVRNLKSYTVRTD